MTMEGHPITTPALNHLGECPICTLPFGFDPDEQINMIINVRLCCSTFVCGTCYISHGFACAERKISNSCPFCRENLTIAAEMDGKNELEKHLKEKLKKKKRKDIVLLVGMTSLYTIWGDKKTAFKYCLEAAKQGDVHSMYETSLALKEGTVVKRDNASANHYMKRAADGNHPLARLKMAAIYFETKEYESAICNLEIAAAQGSTTATKLMKRFYIAGMISKNRLERVFRTHYASRKEIENRKKERQNIMKQQQANGAILVEKEGIYYVGKVTKQDHLDIQEIEL